MSAGLVALCFAALSLCASLGLHLLGVEVRAGKRKLHSTSTTVLALCWIHGAIVTGVLAIVFVVLHVIGGKV